MTEVQTGPGGTTTDRENAYPSDVGDAEWEFLASFLTLMTEDAPQRKHPMRDLLNAIRHVVRGGIPWRQLPQRLPALERRLSAGPAVAAERRLRADRP